MTAVLTQELRDLWLGGRAFALTFLFSVLLSVIAYLTASSGALDFLEQRDSVNLTLQTAVVVGGLLALLVAADAVSGERERNTLEALLVTPVPRASLGAGKLGAALSLWAAAFVACVPYIWFLGRDVGIAGPALAAGVLVGTLVAVALASAGVLVSVFASSNRVSLSIVLVGLLALLAPTQLPSTATRGFGGDLLLRVNPLTAGSEYLYRVVVRGHGVGDDLQWLLAPVLWAVGLGLLALLAARHMRLHGGLRR
jgi:ABC-2 type transport system permease protein